ncbi:hypothetical protein chiPu_0003070 [Chiloscyllium punctatum]|uniref:Uncharacterized protein n=1 Tax=Chiloscyllium punctatum TaxID=137246 RepID=A0A401S2S9_CHIPU|nr:hypothetical protein [Chiloscyllium punctatum]
MGASRRPVRRYGESETGEERYEGSKTAKQISDKRTLLNKKGKSCDDDKGVVLNMSDSNEMDNSDREIGREVEEERLNEKSDQESNSIMDKVDYKSKSLTELIKIVEDDMGRNKGISKEFENIMGMIMDKLGMSKEGDKYKKETHIK